MESTLALDYDKISGDVGHYLGVGRGSANDEAAWDAGTQADIDEILTSGQAIFYFPPILPSEHSSYEWSFIKPTLQRTLASSASTIDMPDDFAGLDGPITIVSTDGAYLEVPVGGVGQILARNAEAPSLTGFPRLVAIDSYRRVNPDQGQRFKLLVWPTADQDYTIQFRMQLLPNAFTAKRPYPYGGAQHAETMKAACIAAAELYKDDERGKRWEHFMDRLATSISIDRRMQAQTLGANLDHSDRRPLPRAQFQTITFNGASPE